MILWINLHIQKLMYIFHVIGWIYDYTGDLVSARNFFAVLLGNATTICRGSGKVLKTSPNDQIFIYYSGHGKPRVLAT